MPPGTTFASALRAIAPVEGWLTDDQAQRLWNAALALDPPGRIVEIGSFRGRSTIVLGLAAADGVEVIAIDPHAGNDRGPQELDGFEAAAQQDHEVFLKNLADAGVADRVRHVRAFSHAALSEVDGEVDVLYIDGAHRYAPALDDIRRWGDRVRPGGTMLIHDSFSSIGVTLAILRQLLAGRDFRYVGRSGSLTEYRREAVADVRSNALAQARQLPWFAGNVVRKALIVAKVRKGPWPY